MSCFQVLYPPYVGSATPCFPYQYGGDQVYRTPFSPAADYQWSSKSRGIQRNFTAAFHFDSAPSFLPLTSPPSSDVTCKQEDYSVTSVGGQTAGSGLDVSRCADSWRRLVKNKQHDQQPTSTQYLSDNCVLLTYFTGDIESNVDAHFARALSRPSSFGPDHQGTNPPPPDVDRVASRSAFWAETCRRSKPDSSPSSSSNASQSLPSSSVNASSELRFSCSDAASRDNLSAARSGYMPARDRDWPAGFESIYRCMPPFGVSAYTVNDTKTMDQLHPHHPQHLHRHHHEDHHRHQYQQQQQSLALAASYSNFLQQRHRRLDQQQQQQADDCNFRPSLTAAANCGPTVLSETTAAELRWPAAVRTPAPSLQDNYSAADSNVASLHRHRKPDTNQIYAGSAARDLYWF